MKLKKNIIINIENNNIDDIFKIKNDLLKSYAKEYSRKYYKENKKKYKIINDLKKEEEIKLNIKSVKIEYPDELNKFIIEI